MSFRNMCLKIRKTKNKFHLMERFGQQFKLKYRNAAKALNVKQQLEEMSSQNLKALEF